MNTFKVSDVQKTEIWFGFGFKKPNRPQIKSDIHSDGFKIETACNPPFK